MATRNISFAEPWPGAVRALGPVLLLAFCNCSPQQDYKLQYKLIFEMLKSEKFQKKISTLNTKFMFNLIFKHVHICT